MWITWRVVFGRGERRPRSAAEHALPADVVAAVTPLGAIPDARGRAGAPTRVDEPDEELTAIWCYCEEEEREGGDRYMLLMRFGGPEEIPFLTLRFAEECERRRVWTWMIHQTRRYREFAAYSDAHGPDEVAKLIHAGMSETAYAVQETGFGGCDPAGSGT
jgi:hypothetical protein